MSDHANNKALELGVELPFPTFASAWSNRLDRPFRLAVGSFCETSDNKVCLVGPTTNDSVEQLVQKATFSHPCPATKLMFFPSTNTAAPDLLMSSSDCLRLWRIHSSDTTVSLHESYSLPTDHALRGPYTSFDWNSLSPHIVCCASTDSTCSVWDLDTNSLVVQIVAHDSEVYDIAMSPTDTNVFCTVGKDGRFRRFDRRADHLQFCDELYTATSSLMRVAWSQVEPNHVCVASADSHCALVFDMRNTTQPVVQVDVGVGGVNSIAWGPTTPSHLCTAGRLDAQIWNISFFCEKEINEDSAIRTARVNKSLLGCRVQEEAVQVQWGMLQPHWVSLCCGSMLRVLRV